MPESTTPYYKISVRSTNYRQWALPTNACDTPITWRNRKIHFFENRRVFSPHMAVIFSYEFLKTLAEKKRAAEKSFKNIVAWRTRSP